MQDDVLKNAHTFNAYIERIGAEKLNFKKYMIKIEKGNYYTEKEIITVNENGVVGCFDASLLPSEDEQEKIIVEFKSIKFPRQIEATTAQTKQFLQKNRRKESVFFEFRSFDRKKIIMIQERRTNKDGTKQYIPWTLFNNAEWLPMEPERGLPFWKPAKKRNKTKIMVHEGAKAASFIDDLINNSERSKERKDHPFIDELVDYEHWGLIGGALAPHRTNYKELHKLKPSLVTYVCDNDNPGRDALQKVSELYGRKMKGVFFPQQWPLSFDLADPIPDTEFSKNGVYQGPSLKDLMIPATFGTEKVRIEGSKKHITVLKPDFADEWVHTSDPELFINIDDVRSAYNAKVFNSVVAPFSHLRETAPLVVKCQGKKYVRPDYNPGEKSGPFFCQKDEVNKINMYRPPTIKPIAKSAKPFLEYMEYLFPVKADRDVVLKWCATLVCRPDIRMGYAMLLISETQGIGKTTLSNYILQPLIGYQNTSCPNESTMFSSSFNEWCENKRLVIINEIRTGDNVRPYNNMKRIITDPEISIERKFQSAYEAQNWVHVFASSNYMNALKVDNSDRRWFFPKCTNENKDKQFWTDFYEWLKNDDGLGKILNYFNQYIEKHGPVDANEHAPENEWKKTVVTENLGQSASAVIDLLNGIKSRVGKDSVIISDQDIVSFVSDIQFRGRLDAKLIKPLTVRKLAQAYGWHVLTDKTNYCPTWGINMKSTQFLTNDLSWQRMTIQQLLEKQVTPISPHEFSGI